MRQFRSIE